MPGKRSEGQRLVAIPMDSELLSLMDKKRGAKNRSQFIREAIAKMLGLSSDAAHAPDRVKRLEPTHRLNVVLNDEPSAEKPSEPKRVTYDDAKPKARRAKPKK